MREASVVAVLPRPDDPMIIALGSALGACIGTTIAEFRRLSPARADEVRIRWGSAPVAPRVRDPRTAR